MRPFALLLLLALGPALAAQDHTVAESNIYNDPRTEGIHLTRDFLYGDLPRLWAQLTPALRAKLKGEETLVQARATALKILGPDPLLVSDEYESNRNYHQVLAAAGADHGLELVWNHTNDGSVHLFQMKTARLKEPAKGQPLGR